MAGLPSSAQAACAANASHPRAGGGGSAWRADALPSGEKRPHVAGGGLWLIHVRGVAGVLHDLDLHRRQAPSELLRIDPRHQPVALAPDDERGRSDAVDSLLEALVRDGPDELA